MTPLIYIAASDHDARFTRICVASVRHWYPDAEVRVLRGGIVDVELVNELTQYWDVKIADVPVGIYGWGFVKLEPLFGPCGRRFLMLDSDTVIMGPVLDRLDEVSAQFIVDREDQTATRASEIYWDPDEAAKSGIELPRSPVYFNTGQWVGTSGVIDRSEFKRLLEWSFPRKLRVPNVFKNGEQGVLNYVVNMLHGAGKISLDRIPLMIWPGALGGDVERDLVEGRFDGSEERIVHWAGLKNPKFERLPGAELLMHFENLYYRRIPHGEALRKTRSVKSLWRHRWGRLGMTLNRLRSL